MYTKVQIGKRPERHQEEPVGVLESKIDDLVNLIKALDKQEEPKQYIGDQERFHKYTETNHNRTLSYIFFDLNFLT